jgi:apolipoprotein N-acyltransferase
MGQGMAQGKHNIRPAKQQAMPPEGRRQPQTSPHSCSESLPGRRLAVLPAEPGLDEAAPGGAANLQRLAAWPLALGVALAAIASGVLLTTAFPPLEWDWAAWVALVPLCLVPIPPAGWRRALVGYLFGFAHYATNLLWLNEIGFFSGGLLALYCALFPALWYGLVAEVAVALGASRPGVLPRPCGVAPGWRQSALILAASVLWVALEWVRGGLFTGFPWNELGVSQWQRPVLLSLTCFTGIAGISFLLVTANSALALVLATAWRGLTSGPPRRAGRAPLLTLAGTAALVLVAGLSAPRPGPSIGTLRVLAVQGNIPQCREWTEEQFREALAVYTELTRLLAPAQRPDLVVWPESAVPAPLGYPPFRERLAEILPEVRTPMLIGALDSRPLPGARYTGTDWDPPLQDYNSALLVAEDGRVLESYDKIHRVPFGEYVPFGKWLPWLARWIGMGRDLTPGSEFTLFDLGQGLRAGVNICFEDAFPEISRQFTLRGATVLMTLTNDAWYAESAGSRQHLLHAVFRAAENRRPLLRSGNNSDTCLILPDGRVSGLLYDEHTGNRFIRGARVYDIPVYSRLPQTLYTRWGAWFQRTCAALAAAMALLLLGRHLRQCRRRRVAIERRTTA